MRLRNRFLLVAFGIVVFVVLTPILVLFTRGYQIDWANRKFVKTGAFVIKTLPTKAQVYLNNKTIKGTTPETVRFLLPGDYVLRIEKDGYQSWTKRLHIQAQIATWANLDRDFIALFYKQPETIKEIPVNFTSISKDGGEIAYVRGSELLILNLANESSESLGDISSFRVPFTFTENLVWSNALRVWNSFQSPTAVSFDIAKIKKAETDGNYKVFLVGDELISLSDAKATSLGVDVTGFTVDGENLWFTQGSTLQQYNFRTGITTPITKNLPASNTSQIIRGEGNTFLLVGNSLYILNDVLEKIYDGVSFANYDSATHKLLFANSNEILLYNPGQKNTELIAKSISPVSHPMLNSYTGYVFFENESKIKAIELDGRDHRNVYTILDLVDADANFALNTEGSILTVFNDAKISSYRIR
jgi:hypothetical protein